MLAGVALLAPVSMVTAVSCGLRCTSHFEPHEVGGSGMPFGRVRRHRFVAGGFLVAMLLRFHTASAQTTGDEVAQRNSEPATANSAEQPKPQSVPAIAAPVSIPRAPPRKDGLAQPSKTGVTEPVDEAEVRFHKATKQARELRVTGGAIALASYGFTALFLTIALGISHLPDVHPLPENPKESHLLPMYVPLVGPLWSLSYSDVSRSKGSWFWFGLSGVGQVVGSAVYIVGVVKTPDKPRKSTLASSVSVVPLIDRNGSLGMGIAGQF